jgi:hypothetical protein
MPAQPEIQTPIERPNLRETATLLRGDVDRICHWSAHWDTRRLALQITVIVIGTGCYGAAMGWWRSPEQALYTAIKFPLIILLTTAGNALINGMLAPLLGLNIPFRQSFAAIIMSFTVASAILGAFSPIVAFLVWSLPPLSSTSSAGGVYNLILSAHVLVIALAGTTGNARLFQLLHRLADGRQVARQVLITWLAGNLFLGSQLSWILRPFVGSPALPVEFLRANAFHGNFYEAAFYALTHILR